MSDHENDVSDTDETPTTSGGDTPVLPLEETGGKSAEEVKADQKTEPKRAPLPWPAVVAVVLVLAMAVGVYAAVELRDRTGRGGDDQAVGAKTLPQAEWQLAEGTDRGLVEAYCSACHSLAPIVTHSGFTEEQWHDEVNKMRESYGAPIDDETAERIIAYLQAHYATDTTPPPGTSEHQYNDPTAGR